MSIKREARHAKQQILEQLTALRDEGKVQLHLLSLDAKKRWGEIEEQINKLEFQADQEGEKAVGVLKETANELTHSLNEFMTKHMTRSAGLLSSARSLMQLQTS